jgi:hypothetical protein
MNLKRTGGLVVVTGPNGNVDTRSLQAAFDTGLDVLLMAGTYMTGPLTQSTARQKIYGQGQVTLKSVAGAADNVLIMSGVGAKLMDLAFDGDRGTVTYVYNKGVVVMNASWQSCENVWVANAPSMSFKAIGGAQYCSLSNGCRSDNSGDNGLFVSDGPDFSFDRFVVTTFCAENATDTPGISTHSPRPRGTRTIVTLGANKTPQTLGIELYVGADDGVLDDCYVDATYIDYAFSIAAKRCKISNSNWIGGLSYGCEIGEIGAQITNVSGRNIPATGIGFAININPSVSADSTDRITLTNCAIFNDTWTSGATGLGMQGSTNTGDHVIVDGFQCFGVGVPVNIQRATYFQMSNYDITARPGYGGIYAISIDTQGGGVGAGSVKVISGTGRLTAAINCDGDFWSVNDARLHIGALSDIGVLTTAGVTGFYMDGVKIYGDTATLPAQVPLTDNAASALNKIQNCISYKAGAWAYGAGTLNTNNTLV